MEGWGMGWKGNALSVHAHEEGDPEKTKKLLNDTGATNDPEWLDSLPGKPRPSYGVSSQKGENVAEELLTTRTFQWER